jgi:hypothetical protein
MTENEVQKQSEQIIRNALSAASEILNLPNRPAQDMIDISQKLADKIIQAAKELSGSGVKNVVNVQPEIVNSSEIVSIPDILKEYSKNSIVAKRKYEGKRLTVQGRITSIGEAGEGFYVDLGFGSSTYSIYSILNSVRCYFDSKYENIILSLKNDQKITINGEWHSNLTSESLLNCEIVNTD